MDISLFVFEYSIDLLEGSSQGGYVKIQYPYPSTASRYCNFTKVFGGSGRTLAF